MASLFVLDCSVTMTWCFEDEATAATDEILSSFQSFQAIVPTIWPLEVANVLLQAKRKKRVSEVQVASFIEALAKLPIRVDPTTGTRAYHSIFALAAQEDLSIYDAAYLELALREKIPLITLDKSLLKSAHRLKISTEFN